jgi:hypothetical protein
MEQTAMTFETYPENPFTAGTQNHVLYERLKRGPIRLSELHRSLRMDTARIRDVRKMLRLRGWHWTVGCRTVRRGETEYYLREG